MSQEELLEQFQSAGVRYKDQLLLPFSDGLRFIEECRKAKLIIERLEFWRDEDGKVIQTGVSADLSSFSTGVPSAVERSARAAAKILGLPKPGGETLVSFTLAEKK